MYENNVTNITLIKTDIENKYLLIVIPYTWDHDVF